MGRRRSGRANRLWLTVAVVVAAATGLLADRHDLLPRFEQDAVALRFQLRTAEAPRDIAVVGIDGPTLDSEGEWPLPRDLHARAVERLRQAGAKVIVYDIQFTEPSGDDAADFALYDAVARARNVILATTETDGAGGTRVLGGERNLRAAGARAADANVVARPGGEVDRVAFSTGGLEALSVAAVERATGREVPAAWFEPGGTWIDYSGPTGSIPTYSLSRLVARKPDEALMRRLRGRIVVVGATAPSLQDVHPTPADRHRLMPGPEVQANAISTVLRGNPLRSAPAWTDALAVLLLAAMPALLSLRARVLAVALGGPVLALAYVAVAQVAFHNGTMVSMTYPLLALATGTLGMVAASYFGELSERRRVVVENDELDRLVNLRTEQLRTTQLELVQRLGNAAESRHGETGAHIHRVSVMSERLARALGQSSDQAELLRHASPLHDVGKIAIPDAILLKPGRLDPVERAVMETHTTIGACILAGSESPLVQLAAEIALSHHEKWDGSGYPHRRAGEDIPVSGRIVAICDVFDALSSPRPYKDPWDLDAVLAEIAAQSGRHFDPAVVEAFLPMAAALHAELGFAKPVTAVAS